LWILLAQKSNMLSLSQCKLYPWKKTTKSWWTGLRRLCTAMVAWTTSTNFMLSRRSTTAVVVCKVECKVELIVRKGLPQETSLIPHHQEVENTNTITNWLQKAQAQPDLRSISQRRVVVTNRWWLLSLSQFSQIYRRRGSKSSMWVFSAKSHSTLAGVKMESVVQIDKWSAI